MIKIMTISILLTIGIYADSAKREPVHTGLVEGCAYTVLTSSNSSSIEAIKSKCNECIVNAPIRKSSEQADLLTADCVAKVSKKIEEN
jgi:hypothetical protein